MNAVYNHRQHKLFTNALSCLSRFSDKLSIRCSQPQPQDTNGYAIRLSAINPAGSAFCAFCFLPDFFDHYNLEDKRRTDVVLNIRTLQNVLKTQFNKKLEKCELTLIEDDVESRLAVILHSFNGVTKTHKLTFEEQKGLFPTSPDEGSKVIMDAKTVQGILDHFGSRTNGEIALVCGKQDLVIKSRNDDFVDRNAKMGKSVWTEVKVDSRRFKTYKVKAEVELTFAMREFKAAIALADHLMLPLELSFSQGGAPLVIKVQCASMLADIFIATSPPAEDEESQNTEEARHSQASRQEQMREQRQETEVQERDAGRQMDLDLDTDTRQESEVVYSGRSALYHHNGPLQSTAPEHPPSGSPLNIATLPRDSSRTPSPSNALFRGPSSPQEISHDSALEEGLGMEMEEAMLAAEARHDVEEEQQRQSQAIASSQQQPLYFEETLQDSETIREDNQEELQEEEYAATDDEEEIPSTQQQEASSKRAKYAPLF